MSKIIKKFHDSIVYSRRMSRLTELLIPMLERSEKILDLGCGDGKIDSLIMSINNKINIIGIDVLVRPNTYIKVMEYDGKHIPYEDETFDTVMAIDVLHHTDDPQAILNEMTRVSSRYIVIKDHLCDGFLSHAILRAMDYVGNNHYKVRLPYNYLSSSEWTRIFSECGLKPVIQRNDLNLYKGILHLLFDRKLHFMTVLEKGVHDGEN